MQLSKLVYKCVKNVIYYDDPSFTYESLKNQNFEIDNGDYNTSLQNVFSPLNEAIHRLSDRNKIEPKTAELVKEKENTFVFPTDISVKLICNIFAFTNDGYKHFPYKKLGSNKLYVVTDKDLNIEYREDIKNFDFDDIQENDVDLKDYGINETMCSYIIEFCKGKLMETLDPGMAAYHNNLAEQYFDGLDDKGSYFNQEKIVNKWGVM